MSRNRIQAIIKKEWLEIKNDPAVIAPLIVLPLIFAVLFPIGILTFGTHNAVMKSVSGLDAFLQSFPKDIFPAHFDAMQSATYAILNYFTMPFFLLIPIMIGTLISSSGFVGEREHRTLEGLLYTPVSIRELVIGKLLAAGLPGVVITWIAMGLYALIFTIGGHILFGQWLFLNVAWLGIAIGMVPLMTFLSIALIFIASPYVKSMKSAQSVSIVFIVPIMGLLISQATGALLINSYLIWVMILILAVIDFIVIFVLVKTFNKEKYVLGI